MPDRPRDIVPTEQVQFFRFVTGGKHAVLDRRPVDKLNLTDPRMVVHADQAIDIDVGAGFLLLLLAVPASAVSFSSMNPAGDRPKPAPRINCSAA